jgi:hypothetical protein
MRTQKAIVQDALVISSNWTLMVIFNKPSVSVVRVFYLHLCFTVQHVNILKHLQVLTDLNLFLKDMSGKRLLKTRQYVSGLKSQRL